VSASSPLSIALSKLGQALDGLEAAVVRRQQVEAVQADLINELALMRDDRQKLTDMLDAATHREIALEKTCVEVNARIDHAVASIRDVLERAA
jgi:predicted  nucleic acid-binding Zn-ribbon protein